ncbi:unnamed protein product, partial [Rotaria sp. Silwood1]
ATLRYVDFSGLTGYNIDYSDADLRGAILDDEQITGASSIFFTILPNGTVARNPNLLINGNAEIEKCLSSNVASIEDQPGGWTSIPANSIGVMSLNSSVAETAAAEWIFYAPSLTTSKEDINLIGQF